MTCSKWILEPKPRILRNRIAFFDFRFDVSRLPSSDFPPELVVCDGFFFHDHCSQHYLVESSIASRTEILRDCVESNLLKAIAGQKLLPAIKVLTDWLRLNGELVMTCVEVCIHFKPMPVQS